METNFNRRDFLKFTGLLPLVQLSRLSPLEASKYQANPSARSNAIIVVYDALSALNMSLYGYPRRTTPNLERFAQRATVFYSHYATGTFTTPGTASILTGTYPWTHRAFHMRGDILQTRENHNLFNAIGKEFYRLGYSHNLLVVSLLHQMRQDLESLPFAREMALMDLEYSDILFPKDYDASIWGEKSILKPEDVPPTSLFLSHLYRLWEKIRQNRLESNWSEEYPQGIAENNGVYYVLEEGINWCIENLVKLPQPFLVYLHFLPPHHPYQPPKEFIGLFEDGYKPLSKPHYRISQEIHTQEFLDIKRQAYDEYLAFADSEFGRLYDFLIDQGLLDNSSLTFTSDHGEMFERGIWGHNTKSLFEPVIKVPLIISKPGQSMKEEIFEPTSNVDLVPTLLSSLKLELPEWLEGQIMPGFSDLKTNQARNVYAMDIQRNSAFGQIDNGSFCLIQGKYKLVLYLRKKSDITELYDLENDPEELEDRSNTDVGVVQAMKAELIAKINEVNQNFNPQDHQAKF